MGEALGWFLIGLGALAVLLAVGADQLTNRKD